MSAILWLIAAANARANQVLSVFSFSTTDSARLEWHPSPTSPPVGLFPGLPDYETSGVVFPCTFVSAQPRCYWDRDIQADLSGESIVSLRVYVDQPERISGLTLYFRSPGGWYNFTTGVRAGWQTIRAPQLGFGMEGTPAGWNQITGIRFSPWKASEGQAQLIATELRAYTPVVTVVRGTRNPPSEPPESFVSFMTSCLNALAIDYTETTDDDVAAAGVPGRVAILPYNTNLSDAEMTRLEEFVGSGGTIIVFYVMPARMESLLGVDVTGWRRISLGGVQLIPGLVECIPEHVDQASWNITLAAPASSATQVLGRWEDPSGNLLTYPAWLLNPHGAFMTHVLLSDDEDRKRRLLLALLAHYIPEIKTDTMSAAFRNIGRVGPFETFEEATQGIHGQSLQTPRVALVDDRLTSAALIREQARKSMAEGRFCVTLDESDRARGHLLEAFFLAQHAERPEFRAVWNHSGTGAFPGDWDRSVRNLAENGFTAVFPNMLWGGLAHYNSALLPHSAEFQQYGDQITACVQACHARRIQVHVWKVNWNLTTAPSEFIQSMRDQVRTQVDVDGNPVDWLCPSNPLNYQLERDTLLEVATQYEVDGLHFDYIRYPDEQSCYCTSCRQRFEADTGQAVSTWPGDCYSGPRKDAYRTWRMAQITRLVQGVHDAVKAVRPAVKISAAVFPDYPSCKTSVGQDWVAWVENGYLDFVCPMDYTELEWVFRNRVANQLALVGGRMPVYPGVGVTASASALSPDQTIVQLQITRDLGTQGFLLFNYAQILAAAHLPDLRKGFTADVPAGGGLIVW